MKKKERLITALDIGASKVCCLIANPPKQKGVIDVLGYGIAHHDCLKKGVVTDIKGLSDAIADAVYEAEEISSKKVQSAFFNITGIHLKGVGSHGEIVISDRDNEITRHDVGRVIANAKSIHMPYERDIIYTDRRDFVVDGEKGIKHPAGMFGIKLETDMYIVTAKMAVIDNLKKAIRQAGIGIEGSLISGIATSSSSVSDHERSLGVILLDIGADLSEITIFLDGGLAFLKVVNFGGDRITKAIAQGLNIPEATAERLKLEHGNIEDKIKDEKIIVSVDSRKKSISKAALNEIILAEYKSLFSAIKRELDASGVTEYASSGIVVCGQPAIMDGSLELAESILNFPVRIGHIMGLGSSPKPLLSHIYATSIGILKVGASLMESKRSLLTMGPKNMAMAAVDYLHKLYNDYF